ncbi:hypothetical protein RPJ47_20325, partial [Salmonella enterica]|uniref:hypothetical protein n=1 Tax=Salmonella enterica TaxID=28901 RepID=UPI002AFE795B
FIERKGLYLPRIGQVENMSVEGLFVHGGDLWRLNTPLSCLQPPQQGKTHIHTDKGNEKWHWKAGLRS